MPAPPPTSTGRMVLMFESMSTSTLAPCSSNSNSWTSTSWEGRVHAVLKKRPHFFCGPSRDRQEVGPGWSYLPEFNSSHLAQDLPLVRDWSRVLDELEDAGDVTLAELMQGGTHGDTEGQSGMTLSSSRPSDCSPGAHVLKAQITQGGMCTASPP